MNFGKAFSLDDKRFEQVLYKKEIFHRVKSLDLVHL